MTKVTQNSFLGGQLDFEMMGRQDFDRYAKGASELVNFNMLQRGGIVKRQGFDRIIDLARLGITEGKVRLVPFAYRKDKGFVLVFSRGKCHAVCTVEGRVWAAWEIPPPVGTGQFATDEEIASFDYQQCGYVLYIAHQNYRPTTISAAADDIDAAIEAGKNWNGVDELESPFIWKTFECTAMSEGVPYVDHFEQTRIAPTPDTAGGLVVEKYKVSAVFDGEETMPSAEAYNTSYIAAVKSCKTTVQTSTMPQYKSRSETKSGGTQTITNPMYADAGSITTTIKTNKQVGTCEGSAYLAPWVESQVIRIVAKVVPRVVGGINVWPEQIRFYKKDKGYYGLIGTSKAGGQTEQVDINSLTFSPGTPVPSPPAEQYETKSSSSSVQAFINPSSCMQFLNRSRLSQEDEFYGRSMTYATGKNPSNEKIISQLQIGTDIAVGQYAEISRPNNNNQTVQIVASSARISFWLGLVDNVLAYREGEDFEDHFDKPYEQDVMYNLNRAKGVVLRASGTYRKLDGTTATFSYNDASVTIQFSRRKYADYNAGDEVAVVWNYAKEGSTAVFSETEILRNINDSKKTQEAQDADQGIVEIPLSGFALALGNSGYEVFINNLRVEPIGGTLYFSGIALQDEAHPDEAYFDDKYITPDASITPYEDDRDGVDPFSQPKNYPACVCLSQQRLIWASSKRNPERVWMSEIGDFKVYTAHEVQKADDAIEFDLPVTRFAKLNHIVEMKSLLAFNDACEWLIDSSSSVQGMTYETVQARPQGYVGSNSRLKPLICGNTVLYCERTGQAVRQFAYNIQDNGFSGTDVSILSKSIFGENNIVDWTYQQFPNSVVWCVLSDGTMASFTFLPEQSIMAWGTHRHGGTFVKFEAVSTSYAVAPSLAEVKDSSSLAYELATHQEVFAVTKDSATGQRWLERMRVRCKAHEDSVYNALTLDSMRVVTDPEDYDIYIEDGNVAGSHPDGFMPDATHPIVGYGPSYYTVNGAWISRGQAKNLLRSNVGAMIFEGYPVPAKFTSVYPMLGGDIGTGQFDIKAITRVGLRLMGSTDGEVAPKQFENKKEPIRYSDDKDHNKTKEIAGSGNNWRITLHDLDEANVIPYGANCRDGRVVVTQGEQWPFAIMAIDTEYALENESGGAS